MNKGRFLYQRSQGFVFGCMRRDAVESVTLGFVALLALNLFTAFDSYIGC